RGADRPSCLPLLADCKPYTSQNCSDFRAIIRITIPNATSERQCGSVAKSVCPLCGSRRARRACPALGREICPVCCPTKRPVDIACPSACGFLSSSRAHPAAVAQRQQERDMRFLLPRIGDRTETQYRLFMLTQALIVQHAKSAAPAPIDSDVAD